MGSNAPPDDVWLAGLDFIAVLEGGAAVVGPTHLPDAGVALNALDAKTWMEALFVFAEIGDELSYGVAEFSLLLRT